MTVAIRDTVLGALITAGVEVFGCFDLDEFVRHKLHRVADRINAVTGTERFQQLGQGRLRQGHR
jgi:hypothetical protein